MKKFIVILSDKRKGTLTQELLQGHVDHLRSLNKRGNLLLCGPLKDVDQGFKVILATSLDEATAFVLEDPFTAEKYYETYVIYELEEANEANNYLLGE